MRVHGGSARRSVGRSAITDRGRTEKNAQRIACQLLEGRAREVPICCKLLSTKGGSGTEGCGGTCRSRIAWLFQFLRTEYFKSAKRIYGTGYLVSRDAVSAVICDFRSGPREEGDTAFRRARKRESFHCKSNVAYILEDYRLNNILFHFLCYSFYITITVADEEAR